MFLAQAKLYALGDYVILPTLQKITFERSRAGLEHIVSGNVVLSPLVEYVYANMVKPADREEPLRRLVTTFITTNLHLLDDEKDTDKTVRNGGDFAADVWNKTRRRMVDSKKRLEDIHEIGFGLSDY
ncbi:hypothetical protein ABVK25_009439 [Lepraria finkii]|uniref:Uncharacterized protein n=1 Tax=Lepraria finkii TaxID=1340010 RepID=A0ABR4AZV4_9LECA